MGTAQALASAAQMKVIEFHTWNSTAKNIGAPGFDYDTVKGFSQAVVAQAR